MGFSATGTPKWAEKPYFCGLFGGAPFLARYFRALERGPIFSGLLGIVLRIATEKVGIWGDSPTGRPQTKSSQTLIFLGFGDLARFGDFRPDLSNLKGGAAGDQVYKGL
jgi:hypothetical protein